MILPGPFGRSLPLEEALERDLQRTLWVAEHVQRDRRKEWIEKTEKIIKKLERLQKKS